jgi:hypothetical protein
MRKDFTKNVLIIDVDTERAEQLQVGKPSEQDLPTTPEEAKIAILMDITCVAEALKFLIGVAHDNGIAKAEDLIENTVNHLNGLLVPVDDNTNQTDADGGDSNNG